MNVVVDSNIIAYYWLPGSHTAQAIEVRRKTDEWFVPPLWRSEFRNILAGFLRQNSIDMDQARAVMRAAEGELADFEAEVNSLAVLDLVSQSRCSAYDCEFVALARTLDMQLVTEDRQILRDFAGTAIAMADITGA